MLHCGNEFGMEVCSFHFKLMTWFQKRIGLLVAPFLELLNMPVLEHKAYFKKLLLIVP